MLKLLQIACLRTDGPVAPRILRPDGDPLKEDMQGWWVVDGQWWIACTTSIAFCFRHLANAKQRPKLSRTHGYITTHVALLHEW